MTMMYKIASGCNEEQLYGIHLARTIGFPDQFVQNAETVSQHLRQRAEQKKQSSDSMKISKRRRLLSQLHETLKQLKTAGLDNAELGTYMRELQFEFVVRMDEIENGDHQQGGEFGGGGLISADAP